MSIVHVRERPKKHYKLKAPKGIVKGTHNFYSLSASKYKLMENGINDTQHSDAGKRKPRGRQRKKKIKTNFLDLLMYSK